jgi:hypothetical protein
MPNHVLAVYTNYNRLILPKETQKSENSSSNLRRFWYKRKGPKSENNGLKIMFSSVYMLYND